MRLENYLCDGANWQAVGVMAYLRSRAMEDVLNDKLRKWENKIKMWFIEIGRFENCREQGYIVSFSNISFPKQINYCFYEHRNCEMICVVRFKSGYTINTPTNQMVFDVMKDKYDTTKDFGRGEILDCGSWIVDDVCKQFVNMCEEKFGD